jgi:hypothetical protein
LLTDPKRTKVDRLQVRKGYQELPSGRVFPDFQHDKAILYENDSENDSDEVGLID